MPYPFVESCLSSPLPPLPRASSPLCSLFSFLFAPTHYPSCIPSSLSLSLCTLHARLGIRVTPRGSLGSSADSSSSSSSRLLATGLPSYAALRPAPICANLRLALPLLGNLRVSLPLFLSSPLAAFRDRSSSVEGGTSNAAFSDFPRCSFFFFSFSFSFSSQRSFVGRASWDKLVGMEFGEDL